MAAGDVPSTNGAFVRYRKPIAWFAFGLAELLATMICLAIVIGAGGVGVWGLALLPLLWFGIFRVTLHPQVLVREHGIEIVNPLRRVSLTWSEIDRAYSDTGCVPWGGAFLVIGHDGRAYRARAVYVNWLLGSDRTAARLLEQLAAYGVRTREPY
jgi:hypothetical protein